MRGGKVKGEKAPVEITLERSTTIDSRCRSRRWWEWDYDDRVDNGDVGVVRVDLWRAWHSLATVDTTFSQSDEVTSQWLKKIASLLRGNRLRAPLIVGLAALHGRAPSEWPYKDESVRDHPQSLDNPIRCIALCIGGSHALVYQPDCYCLKHTGGLLAFREDNKMKKLRVFLANKRVIVACVGAVEVSTKLAEEWGLHVARPTELTDMFARAYGKVINVKPEEVPGMPKKPEKRYYRMSSEATGKAMAKVKAHIEAEQQEYEQKSKQGRWTPKVIKVLSMEYMARMALGPDMRLAPWPAELADVDWGRRNLGCDEWMYATRDAYLCFDIAARCLPIIGTPIN